MTAYVPRPPSSPLNTAGLSHRGAHSHEIAPSGPISGAALPVGDQRVLTQHVRPERSVHAGASVPKIPAETRPHFGPAGSGAFGLARPGQSSLLSRRGRELTVSDVQTGTVAVGNLLGPPVPGRPFGTIGRKPMIAGT